MSKKIDDLFPFVELEAAVDAGLVVRRAHPSLPLCILNYTDKCTYTPDSWNAVTRTCRGLIYHTHTHEIVARPFPKFFNRGERYAPQVDLSARVTVTDKLDGSLGVLYRTPQGLALSTRGSFDSEQAVHATEIIRTRYDGFAPPDGLTLLFEILYPDNRIVVDYGTLDDIVLLGAIDIDTGRSFHPHDDVLGGWPGPRTTVFEHPTLAHALEAPPRPNAEGLVVHFTDHEARIKLKQDDYVALHRIVTGLNERTVWEHVSGFDRATGTFGEERSVSELLEPIPEEFHEWVEMVAAGLLNRIATDERAIEKVYQDILAELPADYTRKDFALRAVQSEWKAGLFARIDGKDFRPTLWKNAKPAARRTPTGTVRTEDAL